MMNGNRMAAISGAMFLILVSAVVSVRGQAGDGTIPLAGTEEPDVIIEMQRIVVTAKLDGKSFFTTPNIVDLVETSDAAMNHIAPSITAALGEAPGIMVQKTSIGQSSPFIRGFTGFRTLFLIDGIRLNNSVFRDGPNQYWTTVDLFATDRMEVMKGPGSVLYGSDAIGGTVNALSPQLHGSGQWRQRLYYRYASADASSTGRFDVDGAAGERFAFRLGGTYRNYDDLRAGDGVGRMPKTGYDEMAGDVRCEFYPAPGQVIILASQTLAQDDIWRTHKTIYGTSWRGTTVGDEKERSLDQRRSLTYAQYRAEDLRPWLSNVNINLSYHLQQEDQHRIKSNDAGDDQGFAAGTTGAWLQCQSPSPIGPLSYGIEYYRDDVDSYLKKYKADGSLDKIDIQGPVADDAVYQTTSAFLQNDIALGARTNLILGARYAVIAADSDKVKDPVSGEQVSLSDDWQALTGSARLHATLDERGHWGAFVGASQGFRAPNLSDLTRLDTARTDELETSALNLDPENFICYDIGIKANFHNFTMRAGYFYTDIDGMIVRVPTGRIIDGDREVTKRNAGDGFVHGFDFGFRARLHPQITLTTALGWFEGKIDTYPTSEPVLQRDYLDKMMPLMGSVSAKWLGAEKRFWTEAECAFAADQDKLSAADQNDTQRIPPGGTPGYAVFNVRAGWLATRAINLSAGIDNLADSAYRIHGSGANEPGRSVLFGIEIRP